MRISTQLNDSPGIAWSNGSFLLQALSLHQYGWQLSRLSSSICLYCLINQPEGKRHGPLQSRAYIYPLQKRGPWTRGEERRLVDEGLKMLMRKYSFCFFSWRDPFRILDSTTNHPALVYRGKTSDCHCPNIISSTEYGSPLLSWYVFQKIYLVRFVSWSQSYRLTESWIARP